MEGVFLVSRLIHGGVHRERIMTSLWAGEGLIYLQTKVRGQGKVVLITRGLVELIKRLMSGE